MSLKEIFRTGFAIAALSSLTVFVACTGDDDYQPDPKPTADATASSSSGSGQASSSGGSSSSGSSGTSSSSGSSGTSSSSGSSGTSSGELADASADAESDAASPPRTVNICAKIAGGEDEAANEAVFSASAVVMAGDENYWPVAEKGLAARCELNGFMAEVIAADYVGYADVETDPAVQWLGRFLGCEGFDDAGVLDSLGLIAEGDRAAVTSADFDQIKEALRQGLIARGQDDDPFDNAGAVWTEDEVNEAAEAFETWRSTYVKSDAEGLSGSSCVN